jgi:hypothetical protein
MEKNLKSQLFSSQNAVFEHFFHKTQHFLHFFVPSDAFLTKHVFNVSMWENAQYWLSIRCIVNIIASEELIYHMFHLLI